MKISIIPEELRQLVENTGVEVVGEVTQKKALDSRTLIGKENYKN